MQVNQPDKGLTTVDQHVLHTIWPCPAIGHPASVKCEDAVLQWANKRRIKVVLTND